MDDCIRQGSSTGLRALTRLQRDLDELLGITHRQPSQHERIDQIEDCRVRPDAERERRHDDDGKSRTPSKQPDGVPHIARDSVQLGAVAVTPHTLLRLLEASKFNHRKPPRFFWRRTFPHLLRGRHLEVRAKFLIQLPLSAVAMPDPG